MSTARGPVTLVVLALCDADFATYFLAYYVRERPVVSLEHAVWRHELDQQLEHAIHQRVADRDDGDGFDLIADAQKKCPGCEVLVVDGSPPEVFQEHERHLAEPALLLLILTRDLEPEAGRHHPHNRVAEPVEANRATEHIGAATEPRAP